MTHDEASRRGLALIRSEPMLFVMELAWRWAFAAGAIGILLFYSTLLRDAISLSATDQNALLSGDPFQIASTVTKVLAGAVPLLIQVAVEAFPLIALLWWLCITFGRALVLRSVAAKVQGSAAPADLRFWAAMVAVHLIRVILLLIPLSAYVLGGRVAVALMGNPESPRVLAPLAAFLLVLVIGIALWSISNFVASLAPIFVAGKRRSWLDALADALSLSLARPKDFFAVASRNAVLRTIVASVITVAGLMLIPLAHVLPDFLTGALAILLTVIYCVASDYLLLARTASYALLALARHTEVPANVPPKLETPLYSPPPDLRS